MGGGMQAVANVAPNLDLRVNGMQLQLSDNLAHILATLIDPQFADRIAARRCFTIRMSVSPQETAVFMEEKVGFRKRG